MQNKILLELIELAFIIYDSLYRASNEKHVLCLSSEDHKHDSLSSCQKVCVSLSFLFDSYL